MPLSGNGKSIRRNGVHKHHSKTQSLGQLLAVAAGDGDVVSIKKLVKSGADVNYCNRSGETPLSFAAAWNHLGAAKSLLKLGADPNIPDKTGGTALMLAIQHASVELVKLLLRGGADATAKDHAGNSVLAHADWRERGGEDEVRKLVRGASRAKKSAVA